MTASWWWCDFGLVYQCLQTLIYLYPFNVEIKYYLPFQNSQWPVLNDITVYLTLLISILTTWLTDWWQISLNISLKASNKSKHNQYKQVNFIFLNIKMNSHWNIYKTRQTTGLQKTFQGLQKTFQVSKTKTKPAHRYIAVYALGIHLHSFFFLTSLWWETCFYYHVSKMFAEVARLFKSRAVNAIIFR